MAHRFARLVRRCWQTLWHCGPLLSIASGLSLPSPALAQPVRSGEAFTFAVKLLGSVDAGRARLALTPPQQTPSGPVVRVVGESEALGMAKALTDWRQRYQLTLDATTLLPRRIEQVDTGAHPRQATFVVSGRSFEMTVKKPSGEWHTQGELQRELLDPMSVLLLLRGLRLHDGDKLTLAVTGGTALYRGVLTVAGRESLQTIYGAKRTIHMLGRGDRLNEREEVIGKSPWLGELWLSDDAARLPLKISAETILGPAEFTLTSYEPGTKPLGIPRNSHAVTVESVGH